MRRNFELSRVSLHQYHSCHIASLTTGAIWLSIFRQTGLLMQKSRLFRRLFNERWSEMGDSNSRHLAPKASALPTALIPDLVIEFCARCGQTCGQVFFLTTSACGGSACIAGVSRDCGHGIFWLEGGATRTQIKRDTNFATPGYSISAIISRREGKSKFFLSVVIPVVKSAFVPPSATGESPRKRRCCKALRRFAMT